MKKFLRDFPWASLAGLILFLPTFVVLADEKANPTIIITASRIAQAVNQSMVPVTVIDQEKIQQSGAVSVAEVLATVPSVNIANSGGVGKQTSLFLRGSESDHVLVLIDGVRASTATSGTASFENIPLSQVERIEVVRGPRSSLYGSEAIGGVIQIFTKKGGQGMRPNFEISLGSHNTKNIEAGISGGGDHGWMSVNASSYRTDGFNSCRGDISTGCFTIESDDDGYNNASIGLSGGGKLGAGFNLEGGVFISEGEVEFDGSFQNSSNLLTQTTRLKGTLDVSENWQSSLLWAQFQDENDSFLNGVWKSKFKTKRDQLSWLNELRFGDSRWTAGLDYYEDRIDYDDGFASNKDFDRTRRDNTGIFAVYALSADAGDFEFSLRSDDNEQFGRKETGTLAYGREIAQGVRLTTSYGSAFKAPSFVDLYYPGYDNPNLVPETSTSFDLGVSGEREKIRWSVNYFNSEIENLISFNNALSMPENISKAEIQGLEFSGGIDLAGWRLNANLTLQDPKNASGGPDDGNRLPRRTQRSLYLDLEKNFGAWDMGASILFSGNRYDGATKLHSYHLVDVYASKAIMEKWQLSFRINNLFDEEYETVANYNQDGMNGLVSLRYIPNH